VSFCRNSHIATGPMSVSQPCGAHVRFHAHSVIRAGFPERMTPVSSRPEAPTADDALMSAIARGDSNALGELYDRYGAILFGLLVRILHDRSEAEDVLQEVFVQTWRRAGDFDPSRGRVLAWLAMLARSRALDRRRALASRNRTAAEAGDESDERSPDAVLQAMVAEDARRVRRALESIPEAQREVLRLAYFEGLSQSEIAARLTRPLGTVKTHTRLGLLRLRELLGEEDER
jgi:RNA polymerase sigma-70 factor, ECF subfamily